MRKLVRLIGVGLVPVLVVTFAGMFLPRAEVSVEPFGRLPLSIGYEVAYASPGTEVRQPDGDIQVGNWTPTPLWPNIDDGSGFPDGTYIVCPGNQTSTGECSVQDPTNVGTYTDVQIKVYARQDLAGGNIRGLDADIRIATNLQGVQTLQATLSDTFTEYTYTWSGLSFSQTDMNSLQILFTSTGATGPPPANRREVHIDYYEVVLTYSAISIAITPPGAVINWVLDPGASQPLEQVGTLVVTITGGPADWSVTAKDSDTVNTNGYMTEWNGIYGAAKLQMPMKVAADSEVTLPTEGEIATGTTSRDVTVTFKQEVVWVDQVNGYRIVVTFTATLL